MLSQLPYDERLIIQQIIRSALDRGLLVSVYDGEEWPLILSSNEAAIAGEIGATDETALRFRDPKRLNENGKPDTVGTVYLVHGNGCDVISDHTDNPETVALLSVASALAERLAA